MTGLQTSPATKTKRDKDRASKTAARRKRTVTSHGRSDASRTTKHDRILSLLSQQDGATIPDLMEATGWQQHSIRGFLAATVKKKLGLDLTSTKVDGELRRYRIIKRKVG